MAGHDNAAGPGDRPRQDVVLIGCGAIMELAHAPALAALDDLCRVRAVVDTVPSRRDLMGDRFGVPAPARHGSLDQLTRDVSQETLAVVAVPTPAAAATVRAVCDAGLPVLAEKPLATSAAGALALPAGAIGVVHNYLHRADVRQALRLLGRGSIGSPRFIRLEQPDSGHFPGRGAQPDWRRGGTAGCLQDNAYHWVYVSEALAGSAVCAVTAQSSAPGPAATAEDVAVMLLRHDNDVLTCVQAAWCAMDATPVLEIHGTTGSVRMVDGRCVVTPSGQDEAAPGRRESSYVSLYRQVFAAARSGERFGASVQECAHVLEVIEAAYRSAAGEGTVLVNALA